MKDIHFQIDAEKIKKDKEKAEKAKEKKEKTEEDAKGRQEIITGINNGFEKNIKGIRRGGGKTVQIQTLVQTLNVTTNNLKESSADIKDKITKVLLEALKDTEVAIAQQSKP